MNLNWHEPTPQAKPASRYVAVRGQCEHKMGTLDAIYTSGLEPLFGDVWELFTVSKQDDKHVWGMFVEGLGFVDVMVPIENVRDLTQAEKAVFSNKIMGMYGSHSGKLSYTYSLGDMTD
jgi:hypothetical protein